MTFNFLESVKNVLSMARRTGITVICTLYLFMLHALLLDTPYILFSCDLLR